MSTQAWIDKQGDVWRLGDDGLMHTPETAAFPPEYVERKWGPLRPVRHLTDDEGHPMTAPTDHMTIAEIIHDFATRQGDLTDRWVREDLAAILEQRMVAERYGAHEKGYWGGYYEGKDEAETRDLDFDAAKDDADKCREIAAVLTIALATLTAKVGALATEYATAANEHTKARGSMGEIQLCAGVVADLHALLAEQLRATETGGAS